MRTTALTLSLILSTACGRDLTRIIDTSDLEIAITTVTPAAAVRGLGCFTVTGEKLTQVRTARILDVNIEPDVINDAEVRVCVPDTVPPGARTLEIGDGVRFVAAPGSVAITETPLTTFEIPAKIVLGSNLVIPGTGFDISDASNHLVTFGGGRVATVAGVFEDRLLVDVPPDAQSGLITAEVISVDPDDAPLTVADVVVVGSFAIDTITPPRADGAFAGEMVTVSLSDGAMPPTPRPVRETTLSATPLVTIDNAPAAVGITDGMSPDMQVELPPGLEAGQVQLCVQGEVSLGCQAVDVLGPGHIDLLRPPNCTAFSLRDNVVRMAAAYPSQTHEAVLFNKYLFFLDAQLGLVQVQEIRNGLDAQTAGLYPLPSDGVYDKMAVHLGCEVTNQAACDLPDPMTDPDAGYIVVEDVLNSAVVVVPMTRAPSAYRFLLPAPLPGEEMAVTEFVVIDRYRFAVTYVSGGKTSISVLDMRALPADGSVIPTSGTGYAELAGIAQSSTHLLPPTTINNLTLWRHWLIATRDAMGPIRFETVDFGPTMTSGIALGPSSAGGGLDSGLTPTGVNQSVFIQFILGSNTATMSVGGATYLVRFGGPDWTMLNAAPAWTTLTLVSVRAESLCPMVGCGADSGGDGFPAVTRETTFNASPGHWFILHSTPNRMPSSTFVAFVPPIDAEVDAAAMGSGEIVLPVSEYTAGVLGNAVIGTKGGALWIPPRPTSVPAIELPRTFVRFGTLNTTGVTNYALPFQLPAATTPEPAHITGTFDGMHVRHWTAGRVGAGGGRKEVVIGWDDIQRELRILQPPLNDLTTAPLRGFGRASVAYVNTIDTFLLRRQHGMRGRDADVPSSAEMALDNRGQPIGAFGVVAGGGMIEHPGSPGDLISVRSRDDEVVVAPATLTFDELDHSDFAGESTITLDSTGLGACVERGDPMTPTFPAVRLDSAGRLSGTCFEAGPGCAHDPTSPVVESCGLSPVDPASTGTIHLWTLDYTAGTSGVAVRTDLCGLDAAPRAVRAGFGADESLFLWLRGVPDLNCGYSISTGHTLASVIVTQPAYENRTGMLTGAPGQTAVSLGSAIRTAGVKDARHNRWLFVRTTGGLTSEVVALSAADLSVSSVATFVTRTEDLLISPDDKRLYLVTEGGRSVWVLDNTEAVPVFLGAVQLPQDAFFLGGGIAMSKTGATIVSAIEGGYCILTD